SLCTLCLSTSVVHPPYPIIYALTIRRSPTSPLFPYTTLFRSAPGRQVFPSGTITYVPLSQALSIPTLAYPPKGVAPWPNSFRWRSEEHTSELQSLTNLVCRLLLEKKKIDDQIHNVHSTYISST